MAKKDYISSNADYIKLKFKCSCGCTICTGLIPVRSLYDIDKDVNILEYDKPVICSDCKKHHIITFYDDIYSSYCEIPTIHDNESIIYLHEIPYEYANGYDNSLSSYINEVVQLKSFMEESKKFDLYDKSTLYKMSLVYTISIMDAYLGNTFRYYITNYELYMNRYVNYIYHKSKVSKDKVLKRLRNQSFQNPELIVTPFYKETFGIDIPSNKTIQEALEIRNGIIHNSGRCHDGYEYSVTESDVIKLINEVEQLVKYVKQSIEDVFFEEIVWPNIKK